MRHRRYLITSCIVHRALCIVLCASCSSVFGAENKAFWHDWPCIGAPIVNYSPETDWVFGAGVQGYLYMPSDTVHRSTLVFDGAYSLHQQWYVHTSGNLYFGGKIPVRLRFRGGYRDYPDVFYPRGNQMAHGRSGAVVVETQRINFYVEPAIRVSEHWYVGPVVDFLYETTSQTDSVMQLGIGLVAQYDTRNVLFYPSQGLFFMAGIVYYTPLAGRSCQMAMLHTDLRQYLHFGREFIFAWQFRTQWVLAAHAADIPYMLLPTLGGQDLVRGVRTSMFRDNAMMALQAEVRIPIWRMVRCCVFAGIGDVYNTNNWVWATPKVGYGLGLRVGINRDKVNIRLDVARSNIYKEWNTWQSYSFYLTATEAF